MLGLSPSSNGGQFGVLFDISSASIGTAVVAFGAKESDVVWHTRTEFGYLSGDDYERYVKKMYATLLDNGMSASTEGFKALKNKYPNASSKNIEIYCVLDSPWFFGAVDTEVVSKEKPFQVTNVVMEKISKEGYTRILNTKEGLSWQDIMGKPELLESYADEIKFEGYAIKSFSHRATKELTVQSFYAIVSKQVQTHIEEVIEKVFPNHEVLFATSTRVLVGVRGNSVVPNNVDRTVLIEVGEEVTNVSLINDNAIKNITSMPFGTNHVLRAIAKNAKNATEAVGSLDVILKNKKSVSLESMPTEMTDALGKWMDDTKVSVKAILGGTTPPKDIMLFVGEKWKAVFIEYMTQKWKNEMFEGTAEPVIHFVERAESKEDKTTTSIDTKLAVLSTIIGRYAR